ncbi:bifunctional DNA-binding transcriptional regulator/antitoxin component of YhaV-PrlF toxin-antitoxin module [Actinoplanes lutulentus]|nr:hypothetical protein [Actinoplanes lutulentus]MBB2940642.1 bifunctional DNA-binding transcriptional regulator/antitoxin component of YhaV-PrlF toxin-antitoxin module [Actinoplanes lutulentus]
MTTSITQRTDTAERLVDALVPPATKRARPSTPLAVPALPATRLPVGSSPSSLHLTIGRPDLSGRVSIRHLLRVMHWSPGDRVDQTVLDDAVIITRRPTGRSVINDRGDLTIPATARALAHLDASNQVVLVAAPDEHSLIIHAESTITALIAQHYARQAIDHDG